MAAGTLREPLDLRLLNDWQHGFPLQREPFAAIGTACGAPARQVIERYRALQRDGTLSRIGGSFAAGAGGAALLCALAVPPERLDAVAAVVSAHAGVNHNYEREHAFNLWFVATGADAAAVQRTIEAIEEATGLPALRLKMLRAYRVDLGFDFSRPPVAASVRSTERPGLPVDAGDRALAALVEDGLPLIEQPFDAWAAALAQPADAVIATLERWLCEGTLRRFGVVVRHHELGFAHNAMAVFDVADDEVDAVGARLAAQPGVTLAYRRERAFGWNYNLYAMVHGRDRGAVHAALAAAIGHCGLRPCARAVLFSRRRFKQTGARYFRPQTAEAADALA